MNDRGASEITAEHIVGTGLATPVNAMITDSNGRAANMVLGDQARDIDG